MTAAPAPGVVVTGHSLGGGLAGLVSTLSGVPGVGFDYMPFSMVAQIYADQYQNTGDPNFQLSPYAFSGEYVTGEILQQVRAGYVQAAIAALGAILNVADPSGTLGDTAIQNLANLLHIPASQLSSSGDAANIAAQTASLDSAIQKQALASYSGISSANLVAAATELHMQDMLVLLQYAQDNKLTSWQSIGATLWTALFNEAIGTNLGLVQIKGTNPSGTGAADVAGQMRRMIGYSAINFGSMPFGDTAIVSLLADADTLGTIVSSSQFSGYLNGPSEQLALTEILVQFSGDQAVGQQTDTSFAKGGFTKEGGVLNINLSPSMWVTTFSSGTKTIVGVQDLTKALLTNDVSFDETATASSLARNALFTALTAPGSPVANVVSGASATEILASISSGATINASGSGANGTADTPTNLATGATGGAIIIGDNGADTITGSSGSDLIVLGNGKNTVNLTAGTDVILGGDGSTTLEEDSSLFNNVSGRSGIAGMTYYISGANGDTAKFGESVKANFTLALAKNSPIPGDSTKWTAYSATVNGLTENIWLDPVDDDTIYLPGLR